MRKVAANIPEFTEWVEEVFAHFTDKDGVYEAPWFRGAGDARFKLIPGLYRTSAGKEQFADDELRSEFMRKALPLVAGRTPRDEWEWYFLMQHYRAPTRLLDWTDAALVALYFALTAWQPPNSPKTIPSKPAVWAINPFALNQGSRSAAGPVNTDSRGFEKYLPVRYSNRMPPQYPLALDPNFISQRMLAFSTAISQFMDMTLTEAR